VRATSRNSKSSPIHQFNSRPRREHRIRRRLSRSSHLQRSSQPLGNHFRKVPVIVIGPRKPESSWPGTVLPNTLAPHVAKGGAVLVNPARQPMPSPAQKAAKVAPARAVRAFCQATDRVGPGPIQHRFWAARGQGAAGLLPGLLPKSINFWSDPAV
jgi:hypothetical protein